MPEREFPGALFAAGLLALPALEFGGLGLSPFAYWESGQVLAYCVIAAFAAVAPAVALLSAWLAPQRLSVRRFLAVCMALFAVSVIAFLILAFSLRVVDSSHGGTIVVTVLANLGIVAAAATWLSRRARRS